MRDSTWTKALLATACLGLSAVGLPGVASADEVVPTRYTQQPLEWGPCLFEPTPGSRPTECALITVPRDWANPEAGEDLTVSISRAKATGQRLGALLVNPGGPGGQGTSMAGAIAGVEPEVNKRYDVIGMNPRGTGHEGGKTPEQQGFLCELPKDQLPGKGLDARDRSPESIAAHQKATRVIAESCQRDPIAPYITTWQTAHDMDLIRTLLGDQKLNFLGYSYGTWLGAKYASLFPGQAGKMILDSNLNWQGRLQAGFEDFPRINQRWLDEVYLPWISRNMPKLAGSTVEEAREIWEEAREYGKSQGLSGDIFDSLFVGKGSAIMWKLSTAIYTSLLDEMRGQDAANAMSPALHTQLDDQARAEFGAPLAELTPARVGDALAAPPVKVSGTRYAVACGDQPTESTDWYRELSDEQGPEYPLYGWAYGLSEVCGPWNGDPRHPLPNLPPEVARNVLVVQGEFDPQTGYEQGKAAVDAAPGVSMVSVDDSATHGQYALAGNACVDGMVNIFLLNNSRPGDATCPSIPLPDEDRVYPVDGPVEPTSQPSSFVPDSDINRDLREWIQERINRDSIFNPVR